MRKKRVDIFFKKCGSKETEKTQKNKNIPWNRIKKAQKDSVGEKMEEFSKEGRRGKKQFQFLLVFQMTICFHQINVTGKIMTPGFI